MGSVKNLFVQEDPTRDELGLGNFVFSDRFSVFDWGEMPDLIPDKGKVLAMMGGYNFELLEQEGVGTHYLGLVEAGESSPVKTSSLSSPTDKMSIHLAHKPEVQEGKSGYRYEDLSGWNNFLIPLEIVFRNYIPAGSSIRRRYDPDDIGLEYDEWPEEEIELGSPLVEYSTKLERQDRYLSREEAFEISGLTEEEFSELGRIATRVNSHLTDHARNVGFNHLDGKIECIYDHGEILVADVVGTFDENRFSFDGRQISKEVLRGWYKKQDENWYRDVVAAKQKSKRDGLQEWTELVDGEPRKLDPELKRLVADLYRAGANRWLEDELFEAPEISQLMEDLDSWKEKMNL